jgi:uncharacterized protein (TIGR02598 family)
MRATSSPGFSLIEVVLALGIVSFAFVGLLGLMPVGLDTLRKAIDTSAQSQIAQQISAEIQRAPFSDISDASFVQRRFPMHFDDQGLPVPSGDPNELYKVDARTPYSPSLPGSTTASLGLLVVPLLVTNASKPAEPQSFSVLIADSGF